MTPPKDKWCKSSHNGDGDGRWGSPAVSVSASASESASASASAAPSKGNFRGAEMPTASSRRSRTAVISPHRNLAYVSSSHQMRHCYLSC